MIIRLCMIMKSKQHALISQNLAVAPENTRRPTPTSVLHSYVRLTSKSEEET